MVGSASEQLTIILNNIIVSRVIQEGAGDMYVCLCNAFTDKQVKQVLIGGARSPAEVYRRLGCAPQCGKCVPCVRQMVKERSDTAEMNTIGNRAVA